MEQYNDLDIKVLVQIINDPYLVASKLEGNTLRNTVGYLIQFINQISQQGDAQHLLASKLENLRSIESKILSSTLAIFE
jgi:hypothetical protein